MSNYIILQHKFIVSAYTNGTSPWVLSATAIALLCTHAIRVCTLRALDITNLFEMMLGVLAHHYFLIQLGDKLLT